MELAPTAPQSAREARDFSDLPPWMALNQGLMDDAGRLDVSFRLRDKSRKDAIDEAFYNERALRDAKKLNAKVIAQYAKLQSAPATSNHRAVASGEAARVARFKERPAASLNAAEGPQKDVEKLIAPTRAFDKSPRVLGWRSWKSNGREATDTVQDVRLGRRHHQAASKEWTLPSALSSRPVSKEAAAVSFSDWKDSPGERSRSKDTTLREEATAESSSAFGMSTESSSINALLTNARRESREAARLEDETCGFSGSPVCAWMRTGTTHTVCALRKILVEEESGSPQLDDHSKSTTTSSVAPQFPWKRAQSAGMSSWSTCSSWRKNRLRSLNTADTSTYSLDGLWTPWSDSVFCSAEKQREAQAA